MQESLTVTVLVSTLLGFLTGLGVGGGSLLMVWLTAVLEMDAITARGINLLFFLPSALIAICFRKRQGQLKWKAVLPPAAAGCITAALCSKLSTVVDNSILNPIFGAVLIAAGIRELFSKTHQ